MSHCLQSVNALMDKKKTDRITLSEAFKIQYLSKSGAKRFELRPSLPADE